MAAIEANSLPSILSKAMAYYRMEGNGNDSIASFNLTNSGGTFSSGNGKFNQGVGFTGAATSWLTLTNLTGFPTGTNAKSISCWFSPKSQPGTNVTFGINGFWGEESMRTFDFYYKDVSGTKYIGFRYGNPGAQQINYTTTCSNGTWYHLAATYDGSTIILYLNGINVVSVGSISLDTQANPKLVIGGFAQSDIYGLWGNVNVDDFLAYNQYLTPSDVNLLANGPPASSGISGYAFLM